MKDSLRGSSVVAKSMLAQFSSKQTLARYMISAYRVVRLTSAKQVGACHDRDETKAVVLRGCFSSYTTLAGNLDREMSR